MTLDASKPYSKAIQEACKALSPTDTRCPCILDAIAHNDSNYATAGAGGRLHNIGNMRCLDETASIVKTDCAPSLGLRNGYFASFHSVDDSITASADLYVRRYAGKDWDQVAVQWAQTDPEGSYGQAIKQCYTGK